MRGIIRTPTPANTLRSVPAPKHAASSPLPPEHHREASVPLSRLTPRNAQAAPGQAGVTNASEQSECDSPLTLLRKPPLRSSAKLSRWNQGRCDFPFQCVHWEENSTSGLWCTSHRALRDNRVRKGTSNFTWHCLHLEA